MSHRSRHPENKIPMNWDLGLSLLEAVAAPEQVFTYDEIAIACGVSESAVLLTEQRALRKVRNKLQFTESGAVLAAELILYLRKSA